MPGHLVPRRIYFLIFAALMVLTAVTVAAAFYNLGALNTIVALTIAVIKALLVVLFFMHLRYSSQVPKIFAAAGFFWLALLLSLTLSDYISRGW